MMTLRRTAAALAAAALVLAVTVSASAHPLETVPPGHWAYAALRHLAAMGLVPFRSLAHLPLTRGEIAALVRSADQAAGARVPSVGTRDLLTALRAEFLPDARPVRPQVIARAAPTPSSLTAYPGVAPGSFGGAGAGIGGATGIVWAEGGLSPTGTPLTRAYGMARFGDVYLQIGREIQQWSPSPRSSLLLSEWAGGVDLVRLVVDSGRFRFTKFVSPLRPGPPTVFLVGTRLDWQATDGFRIGFSESVLTIPGRTLAYALLNPLPVLLTQALDPTRIQVRYFRDPVNFLGAVDFDWLIRPGLVLSGQLLVDDFSATGNTPHRLGGLLAATWGDLFRNGRTSLRIEYSAVLNYTYTEGSALHLDYILPSRRLLGYWLGNDADDLVIEVRHVLNPASTMSAWLVRTRHGKGRVGGTLPPSNIRFRNIFLSGIVEDRVAVGAQYETHGADRTVRYWGEIGAVQNQNNARGRNVTDLLVGVEFLFRW